MTYFNFDCQSDNEMSYQVSLLHVDMQYVADSHKHIPSNIRKTEAHNAM